MTLDLDGVVMHVTATAANGVVDRDTRVSFRQRGSRVVGRYSGGKVRRGWLVGTTSGNRLTFRYVQAESTGAIAGSGSVIAGGGSAIAGGGSVIHAGRSTCEIEALADGRLRLLEHFAWSTRPGGGTNVFEQDS